MNARAQQEVWLSAGAHLHTLPSQGGRRHRCRLSGRGQTLLCGPLGPELSHTLPPGLGYRSPHAHWEVLQGAAETLERYGF